MVFLLALCSSYPNSSCTDNNEIITTCTIIHLLQIPRFLKTRLRIYEKLVKKIEFKALSNTSFDRTLKDPLLYHTI